MSFTAGHTLGAVAAAAGLVAAAPSIAALVMRTRGKQWSRRVRSSYGTGPIVGWDTYTYTYRVTVPLPLVIPRLWRDECAYNADQS